MCRRAKSLRLYRRDVSSGQSFCPLASHERRTTTTTKKREEEKKRAGSVVGGNRYIDRRRFGAVCRTGRVSNEIARSLDTRPERRPTC